METYLETHDLYLTAVARIEKIARNYDFSREMKAILEIIDETYAQVDRIETEEWRKREEENKAWLENAA